ncbi:hypothetical protein [Variovorax atrisoli]|uniref:hypothetical protein n=1 Tax=Variovorax atrisoli TaxID=3394203 RepID=UPI003394457E
MPGIAFEKELPFASVRHWPVLRWTQARRIFPVLLLSTWVLTVPAEVRAQVKPEIASCSELQDEAAKPQFEMCAAHTGCRYILNVQKTCARAKSYLDRLQIAIGEGTKTLFFYRKEVTPDAVFAAVLGADELEKQRQLAGNLQAQRQAKEIEAQVREVGRGDEYSGRFSNGSVYIYYGQLKDGVPDGIGTRIASDGEIQRGQFDGNLYGAAEILFPDGSRFVGQKRLNERTGLIVNALGRVDEGTYASNTDTFTGSRTYPDGTRFQGRFDKSTRTEGKFYRADKTLAEEGKYENGQLSVGAKYDEAGARTEVNLPAERAAAARDAAEKIRLAAQAEQQLKREEAARAEQQFQASLQTMNPGQLFARADELKAQGDNAHARDVQRALISRFPSHPLAVQAARQISGDSTPQGPADTLRAASNRGSTAASSKYSSVCVRNSEKINKVLIASGEKNYAGYGAGFSMKAKRLAMQVLTPCASQDPRAANLLAQLRQQLADDEKYCAGPDSRSCSEWGSAEYEAKHRAWLAVLQREVQTALSNPNGYSADLDGGEASRQAARPGQALSAQECAAKERVVSTTRVPANASITASTETVMFMTKTALEMIAGGCRTDGTESDYRKAYEGAEKACNAVQSGGRRCAPQLHSGAGGPSKPPATPAAPSREVTASYDPVSGVCTPAGHPACADAPGPGGRPGSRSSGGGSSSGSSGGGIRTAR